METRNPADYYRIMNYLTFVAQHSQSRKLKEKKHLLMGLVLAAAFMTTQRTWAAGPEPINLRSAAHFTILATSTTTTTGGGIINGDVGLSPVGSQGIPPGKINGTIYNGDANGVAAQAQLDLTAAIIASSPAQLPGGINAGAELGSQTLVAGVYQSPSGSYGITGISRSMVVRMMSGFPDGEHTHRSRQWQGHLDRRCPRPETFSGRSAVPQLSGTSSVFKGTIMTYASIR